MNCLLRAFGFGGNKKQSGNNIASVTIEYSDVQYWIRELHGKTCIE